MRATQKNHSGARGDEHKGHSHTHTPRSVIKSFIVRAKICNSYIHMFPRAKVKQEAESRQVGDLMMDANSAAYILVTDQQDRNAYNSYTS